MRKLFRVREKENERASNNNFRLHSHEYYEIYMFIEGDSKYIVEGNTYNLKPYDMIIIRKNEMHRVYHNSSEKYRRFVITVQPEFFKENNCTEYEEQFLNVELGNKIEAGLVISSGIYDTYLKFKKYTRDFTDTSTPIAKCVLTEILYLLSQTKNFTKADSSDESLSMIIEYLNNNFTENITLDMIKEKFYVSIYHLCRKFKMATGLTIHQYITGKRINLVRELAKTRRISEASEMAGFSSYSSFYRAYKQEFGKSPKFELKV